MRYILVFALAASLAAQEKVAETIEVRVANVDVVVTDRTGHPVHGLTKDDFEILENGKPQTITNFYEVGSAPSLPLTVSTPSSGQTPPPVPQTTAAATAPTRRGDRSRWPR